MNKGISCCVYFSWIQTDSLLRNFNGCFNDFCIVNSPNVNSLFYCFAESPSIGTYGETLKAFVFSLKNSEGLPKFKCFAKNKRRTVYKGSAYGPTFGLIEITYRYRNKRVEATAFLYEPYSVPAEVNKNYNVLVGSANTFFPDNYEVFFLAWNSFLENNKQTIKEKNPTIYILLNYGQQNKLKGGAWGAVGLSSFFIIVYYYGNIVLPDAKEHRAW